MDTIVFTTTVHEQAQWNRVWYVCFLHYFFAEGHGHYCIHYNCSWTGSMKPSLGCLFPALFPCWGTWTLLYSLQLFMNRLNETESVCLFPALFPCWGTRTLLYSLQLFMHRLNETESGMFVSCIISLLRDMDTIVFTTTVHEQAQWNRVWYVCFLHYFLAEGLAEGHGHYCIHYNCSWTGSMKPSLCLKCQNFQRAITPEKWGDFFF